MSAQATQATPQDDPGPQAVNAPYYRGVLHGLIDRGADLARLLHEQATAQAMQQAAAHAQQAAAPAQYAMDAQPAPAPAPAPGTKPDALNKTAAAFDQIARAVRRCVALAQSLDEPAKPARTPAPDRTAARKHILRAVEDTLGRQDYDDSYRDCDPTETLHAELLDRMDAPDLDRDIESRPIDDIIKDILRDLGLAALPGTRPWKRRTPADIAELCARAAAPTAARQPGAEPHHPARTPTQPAPDPQQDQREPGEPAEPAATPGEQPGPTDTGSVRCGPIHPGPGLPKDPAEAVAFVLHHSARTGARWRPPPGS